MSHGDNYQYSDLLIHYLEKEGVEYVFGIPGGALEPVFNALARSELRGGIKPILTKHEQGAAFMADGYARISGRLGVCCATTGPGASNLFAGITTSYADSIPVLALTAQIPVKNFGKNAFQDSSHEGIDMVEVFKKSTLYSALVINSQIADDMFRKAIRVALTGKRGPVHLSLPSDVMAKSVDEGTHAHLLASCYVQPKYFDRKEVKDAVRLLMGAKKPAMLVGSGAIWSGAAEKLKELAEMLSIPTATTPKAKGTFPENHELAWALHYLPIIRPGTFYAPLGFSCMGYAVAGSIGGKLAAKQVPVIAIVGDGGFLMNGMEVATAVNYNIAVIWIILNDGGLGMVRHGQRMSDKAMETSHAFIPINFVALAESLGAVGVRINKAGQLDRKLMQKLIAMDEPVIIDVLIDPDEVPPIGSRLGTLKEVYDEI